MLLNNFNAQFFVLALRSGGSILRGVFSLLGLILLLAALFSFLRHPAPEINPTEPPTVISGTFATVVIDPGHGGTDEGAASHGLKEKQITLDLGTKLAAELNRQGIGAVLTRTKDESVSLADRCLFANSIANSIFVSLHCNFSNNGTARGLEVYRCFSKTAVREIKVATSSSQDVPLADVEGWLADEVIGGFSALGNWEIRGAKSANFFVVRNVQAPAVLVECGFVTNQEDARKLADESARTGLVEAICRGIISYRKHLQTLNGAGSDKVSAIDLPSSANR